MAAYCVVFQMVPVAKFFEVLEKKLIRIDFHFRAEMVANNVIDLGRINEQDCGVMSYDGV